MTSPDTNAKYIVYKLYDDVKKEFDRSENFTYEQNEFDKIINDINMEREKLNIPIEIFTGLNKRLKNYNVFFNAHLTENFCIFVNFWLNKELRKKYANINPTIFNILDKFVVNFNIDNYNIKENTCHGYIKYLNPDVYKKMLILDDLYNKYKQLKSFNGTENDDLCTIFSFMGQIYKPAFDNNKSDSNFIKKLEEYTDLIKTNKWATNTRCPAKYYITLPKPDTVEPLERSDVSKQSKASPQVLESQQLSRGQDTVPLEDVSATHESLKPTETRNVPVSSELLGTHDEHATRRPSGLPYALGPSMPKLQADPENAEFFGTQERSAMTSTEQIFTPPGYDKAYAGVMMRNVDGRITELNSNPNAITKDGLLDKMQNFFTGTLGQVDPVPVVGVSGGMGALFLLFRYTPVGTFFRGGRGRANRIPRSFNGQFLGGFPGYEDYDVGHIGYGPMNPLAE
ncbi:hypothetical protein, conserved [Plasmodium vivax]|uniref:VIR protein n=1 Tax=Plasmodium vivax TaxID=5855 RepID=A0A1G4ECB4_PLAVI|nr:hypothetical protein, conserved [Plasmodium vivax]